MDRALFQCIALTLGLLTASTATASPPEGSTATLNGIQMYYEVVGEGEPLVLLHGGTQTGAMWQPFIAEWSRHYRLVIPDLRGHGRSTNPEGIWTTHRFADDVLALLDELGIESYRAVGASVGAMTLLRMATSEPDRVQGLVVVGAGTYLPESCREILATTDASTISEAGWARLRARHHHGDDQIRALYTWVASLATSYEDMVFTPPLLATVTAPTLVVHGDHDYCFPPSMAAEIAAAIPHAFLWVIPNGSHVPIGGSNEGPFRDTVLEFLDGAWDTPAR